MSDYGRKEREREKEREARNEEGIREFSLHFIRRKMHLVVGTPLPPSPTHSFTMAQYSTYNHSFFSLSFSFEVESCSFDGQGKPFLVQQTYAETAFPCCHPTPSKPPHPFSVPKQPFLFPRDAEGIERMRRTHSNTLNVLSTIIVVDDNSNNGNSSSNNSSSNPFLRILSFCKKRKYIAS